MGLRIRMAVLPAIVSVLFVFSTSLPTLAQPHFSTIILDENVDSSSTSIALDSQGRPHIAYYDITYPGYTGVRHVWYDGRTWQYDLVDRIGYPGSAISLALDSNDRPHLVYINVHRDESGLDYAYYDGTRWRYKIIESSTNSITNFSSITISSRSLVIDPNNNRHLSYGIHGGEVKYATSIDGSSWSKSIRQEYNYFLVPYWFNGSECPLALDHYNRPKILYSLTVQYFLPIRVMELKISEFDGEDYRKRVLDTFDLDGEGLFWRETDFKSLAVDNTGLTHIIYNSESGLIYQNFSCGPGKAPVCNNSGKIEVSPALGLYNSLALDTSNRPHVSFYDDIYKSLGYAFYTGSSWETTVISSSSPGEGTGTSLALDPSDRPHISFVDGSNNLLKYAFICQDPDNDGYCDNYNDNCPGLSNSSQGDTDQDGVGNTCDNCRYAVNPNQRDSDGDGVGDACDNCPWSRATTDQTDTDGDGVGDACDNCPAVPNGPKAGTCIFGTEGRIPCNRNIDFTPCEVPCEYQVYQCVAQCLVNFSDTSSCVSECYQRLNRCLDVCSCGTGGVCSMAQEPTCGLGFWGQACETESCFPKFKPIESVEDTIPPGGWRVYQSPLVCNTPACSALASLHFGGSTLKLSLFRPDGTLFGSQSGSQSPITISIPGSEVSSGFWGFRVDALDVPQNDYPFRLEQIKVQCEASDQDHDQDGICGNVDNCPNLYNPDQRDTDGDGIGDICDNCPEVVNPDQVDTYTIGVGDACRPLRVIVDIQPDECLNVLNLYRPGLFPVAILGSTDFDVTQIDPASVRLEGMPPLGSSLEDLTNLSACVKAPDGYPDLIFNFDLQTLIAGLKQGGLTLKSGQRVNLVISGTLKEKFGAKPISSGQAVQIEGWNLFLPLVVSGSEGKLRAEKEIGTRSLFDMP